MIYQTIVDAQVEDSYIARLVNAVGNSDACATKISVKEATDVLLELELSVEDRFQSYRVSWGEDDGFSRSQHALTILVNN